MFWRSGLNFHLAASVSVTEFMRRLKKLRLDVAEEPVFGDYLSVLGEVVPINRDTARLADSFTPDTVALSLERPIRT